MGLIHIGDYDVRCIRADACVQEGDRFPDFHVYVCGAFLEHWSKELMELDFQEAMFALQQPPTTEWQPSDVDVILSQAYTWRHMFKSAPQHLDT